MAIFYVSKNGDDSNDGLTLETAFATPAKAKSQANSLREDTTVYIDKGVYNAHYFDSIFLCDYAAITWKALSTDINDLPIFTFRYATSVTSVLRKTCFYNIIFQIADVEEASATYLLYIKNYSSSYYLEFYNCVFKRSIYNQPSSCFIKPSESSISYHQFYNCTFCGNLQAFESARPTCTNCVTENVFGVSGNFTDCLENVIVDDEYYLINEDNDVYGVYANENKVTFMKACIKKDNEYYSILQSNYNVDTKSYIAYATYEDAGFFRLSDLFREITIEEETFRPIDKFSGNIQIIFNKNVQMAEMTAYESVAELVLGNMIDIRSFKEIQELYPKHNYKTILLLDETQWVTYDFDNNQIIPLNINIPLDKQYSQLTMSEKNDWENAVTTIEAQGLTVNQMKNLDFNTINCNTVRLASVMNTTACQPFYELISKTLPDNMKGAAVIDGEIYANGGTQLYKFDGTTWQKVGSSYNWSPDWVVYNNEIHLLGSNSSSSNYSSYRMYHYKWNGSSWQKIGTLPYAFHGLVTVYNNEIHILGSYHNSSHFQSHYRWDGSSWHSVSTLPVQSQYLYDYPCCEYHGCLYFGYGGKIYQWDGEQWEQKLLLPSTCDSAVVYNDKMHFFSNNNIDHFVWDGQSDVVETATNLPVYPPVYPWIHAGKIHLFAKKSYYTYEEPGFNYLVSGSKYANCNKDALTLFNSTEVGFENENDGFSNNCENRQLPIFTDNNSRMKTQDGIEADWWTTTNVEIVEEITNEETGEVTTTTHTEVATVSSDGVLDSSMPNVEKGVCFGFNI